MSVRPLFQLDPRLQLCASLVDQGVRIADIGTDHAYLPVWLARKGWITHGIACDLRSGPLEQAKKNIDKYNVREIVETRLSDGLVEIAPEEVDVVTIAGMGADVMIHILEGASWLKEGKILVLQPMSSVDRLRRWLNDQSYALLQEKAVQAQGKIYSAMKVRYEEKREKELPAWYPYIGLLDQDPSQEATEYIARQALSLEKRKAGLLHQGETDQAKELEMPLQALKDLLKTRRGEEKW